MNPQRLPCVTALDRECFRAHPGFARRALAYRLLHLLIPPDIARLLPKRLSDPLVAPGVEVPLGAVFPPGTVIVPGCDFPAGWKPEDEPPECTKSAPLPTLAMQIAGGNPSTFLSPGEPGTAQVHPPAGAPPPTTKSFTGDTADGQIEKKDAVYLTARNATSGTVGWTGNAFSNFGVGARERLDAYTVFRWFLFFDVSNIPSGSTPTSAILTVGGKENASTEVSLHKGTQHNPLEDDDFNNYDDDFFSKVTWQISGVDGSNLNEFDFDQAGLDYLTGIFTTTGIAKFCLRNYTYDYLPVAPPDDTYNWNGLYLADQADELLEPILTITYK